jgi:ArsR family transcriptional regulator, arsenate/arsenite/antimonite-responsive transcriptional repressor
MAKQARELTLDTLFKALADPIRLRLLNLIGDQEVCVCFFVEALDAPQPTISRHLAYLRRSGLVNARRDGKWMHYSLVMPTAKDVAEVLKASLKALRSDPDYQRDRARLNKACCGPQSLVQTIGAPIPANFS